MNAALQQQLTPTEQSESLSCHPTISADHHPGDEASQVQVTVSETCTIVAYNSQELTARAMQQLSAQAGKQFGTAFTLYGTIQVSVTKIAAEKPNTIILTFVSMGTWVYGVNQQRIISLIAGKPRLQ